MTMTMDELIKRSKESDKKKFTPEEMCDLMVWYRILLKEGKTMAEIHKIFNVHPENSPVW